MAPHGRASAAVGIVACARACIVGMIVVPGLLSHAIVALAPDDRQTCHIWAAPTGQYVPLSEHIALADAHADAVAELAALKAERVHRVVANPVPLDQVRQVMTVVLRTAPFVGLATRWGRCVSVWRGGCAGLCTANHKHASDCDCVL